MRDDETQGTGDGLAPSNVSDSDDKTMEALLRYQEASFEGPIPPPALLRGYDEIVPGLAREIVDMAKQAQAHRIALEREEQRLDAKELELEEKQLDKDSENKRRAQYCSTLLGIAVLATVAYLGSKGLGGTAGTVAVAFTGIIAAGILGKRWRISLKEIDEDDIKKE